MILEQAAKRLVEIGIYSRQTDAEFALLWSWRKRQRGSFMQRFFTWLRWFLGAVQR